MKIEGFRKRLEWMMLNIPHDASFLGVTSDPVDEIRNSKELAGYVRIVLGGKNGTYPVQGNWDKYLKSDVSVPPDVLAAIMRIYPAAVDVPEITSGTLVDFYTALDSFDRRRWEAAAIRVEGSRAELADISKKYHANDDATPDLPLITQKGWLLTTPQKLTQNDRLPRLYDRIRDVVRPKLDGWIGGYTFLKKLRTPPRSVAKLYNGPTYRVMEIEAIDDQLSFRFAPGKYYDFLDTSEVLGGELADFLQRHNNRSPTVGDLPLRGESSDVMRFWSRSASLGVNCLTIIKGYAENPLRRQDARDVFLMHKRGTKVIEAQNVWHVMPAGSHAPVSSTEYSGVQTGIWWTVAREFIEECFDTKEAQGFNDESGPIFDRPRVEAFMKNVFSRPDVVQVFLLGVGLDPVNLKPEAMVAIVIDWEKMSQADWSKISKDPTKRLKISENYEGNIQIVDLEGESSLQRAASESADFSIQPAGAGCLLLAAKSLKLLLSSV